MSGAQRTRRPSARIQLSPKQANITLGVGRKTPACPGLKHLVTDFVKPNVPGVRSWIHGRPSILLGDRGNALPLSALAPF
jgi:hypothetical protein